MINNQMTGTVTARIKTEGGSTLAIGNLPTTSDWQVFTLDFTASADTCFIRRSVSKRLHDQSHGLDEKVHLGSNAEL